MFLNESKQFTNAEQLKNYVESLPKPSWPMGSTFHNTVVPDVDEWRGSQSMLSMQRFYEQKIPAWDRGPHLYIAKGSPDPANDGIWIMTPPNRTGIHAGPCNGSEIRPKSGRWGVELVGDFDKRLPTDAQLDLLTDAIAVLHNWIGIQADLNAHRDCMPGRTCPGGMFYSIKNRVISMLESKINIWSAWGIEYPLPEDQRLFGIPQAWYKQQVESVFKLGAAKSNPVYSGNTVTQLFINGLIIFRGGSTRVIFYSEFRVP